MIVMAATDILPIILTVFICVLALTMTGVISPAEAFAGCVNSNVILIAAMIVVGGAFFRTGMAHDMAMAVLKRFKLPKTLLFGIVIVTGLISSVNSNTATTAIMLPIVIGICENGNINRSKLVMPIACAASIGGTITLVGTTVNLIGNSTLEEFGYVERFSMFEFVKMGLPILVITAVFLYFFGEKLMPDRPFLGRDVYNEPVDYSNVPKWKKYMSLVIMLATFLGMSLEPFIHIPLHVTAVMGACLTVLTRTMTEKEALLSFDLKSVFLVAMVLPIATGLNNSGAGKLFADTILNVFGQDISPIVLMIILYLASNVTTQFMSNTAAAGIFCPIGIAIVQALNANPKSVLLAVMLGSSYAFATPIGMPGNTMVWEPGGYKFGDFTKVGIPLLVISFIYCVITLPIFYPMGI
jgi:anion transporter